MGEVPLFPAAVLVALREGLRPVAVETVAAVVAEVPSYSRAFAGPMGATIETAVELALGGFIDLASRERGTDPSMPLGPVSAGAYDLGRGEARSGRSMDALLSAYRVGARVAWRGLSARAVESRLDASALAAFAEMVFAYIDQLSAASVAGHTDELETRGRVLERYRERLATRLLTGGPADAAVAAAERAEWSVPETLTVVLAAAADARVTRGVLSDATLATREDLPELEGANVVPLLVPDANRKVLMRLLAGRRVIVGPTRPWLAARSSYERAVRMLGQFGDEPLDTEAHLAHLVLSADSEARADLRSRALNPLDDVKPASRAKLEETLRIWLLCQGRRDDVAERLFVHPQTVRYRMGQLRELFGDRLTDPDAVLELTLALG